MLVLLMLNLSINSASFAPSLKSFIKTRKKRKGRNEKSVTNNQKFILGALLDV